MFDLELPFLLSIPQCQIKTRKPYRPTFGEFQELNLNFGSHEISSYEKGTFKLDDSIQE